MTSYIYFVQALADGPIKIGVTGFDPRKRMVKIQSDCPWPIKLLGAIDGTAAQEKQIHLLLARYRTQGEWFSPNEVVLAAVQEALSVGTAVRISARRPKHIHPLCQYRTDKRLTLYDLSAMTGITPSNLSRFESGKVKPNAKSIKSLCLATGIPASKLRPDWASIFGGAQ